MRILKLILILFAYLALVSCQRSKSSVNSNNDSNALSVSVEHSDFDSEYEKLKSSFVVSNDKRDNYNLLNNRRTKEYIDSILTEEFKEREFIVIIIHTGSSILNDTVKLSWNKTGRLDTKEDTILYNTRLFWRAGNKTIKILKSDIKGNFQLSANKKPLITFDIPKHYNYIYIGRVWWSPAFIIEYRYTPPFIAG